MTMAPYRSVSGSPEFGVSIHKSGYHDRTFDPNPRLCRIVLGAAAALILASPLLAQDKSAPIDIQQALEDLNSKDWIIQLHAMKQLSAAGSKEAIAPLKAILTGGGNAWSRGRALVALAEIQKTDVLQDALAHAKGAVPELRAAAVEALGIIGDAGSEGAILERLKDQSPAVQCQALVAYARLKKASAYPTVAAQLKSADTDMVRHAAKALVYVANDQARRSLIELLDHKEPAVRIEAAAAIGRLLDAGAIPALLAHHATDADAETKAACKRSLACFDGKTLAGPLGLALKSTNTALYVPAVELLGAHPSAEVCDNVAAILATPNAAYDQALPAAMQLLYTFDAPRYQSTFALYLTHKDPDGRVRIHAVEGLARCPKADHFELFRQTIADPNRYVALQALTSLSKVTTGAPKEGIVKYLAKALDHADTGVAGAAIGLLKDRVTAAETNGALAALDKFLGGANDSLRDAAAAALDKHTDDDTKRRVAAAEAYITDWMTLGPYGPDRDNKGLAVEYTPEKEIDFKKTYDTLSAGAAVSVADATAGGAAKKALLIVAPSQDELPNSRTSAVYALEVPAGKDVKLAMALALREGAQPGTPFEVVLDGKSLLSRQLDKSSAWDAVEIDLSAWAGRSVTLELQAGAAKNASSGAAFVGSPVITAGEKKLDLLELAASSSARIVIPGKKSPQLAWTPLRVNTVDGMVHLDGGFVSPPANSVSYAVADFQVPPENFPEKAVLSFSTSVSCMVWLNGQKLKDLPQHQETKIDVTLQKGANRLVVKALNNYSYYQFRVRLVDPKGMRISITPAVPDK
ncbi:MAG: HEAT repeat domain-containing protein [Phycisphaerae bacterium]